MALLVPVLRKQAAILFAVWVSLAIPASTTARQRTPRESHPCCETTYDFVSMPDGSRLRTIVTRPRDRAGRLPAVLFVGWLSCDSVELRAGAEDGWSRFQRALISDTGAVVMRMDKPGVGESDGVCAETGFDAEVAGYRAALQALKRLDYVDINALAVVGASMGGAIAPLVVQGESPKAVAVWGTFAGTWLEHLLAHERRRLNLAGNSPAAVNEKMQGLGELHARILLDRLRPRDVLQARPQLRPLWYGEPDGLYGRPAAFHHQAQAANVVAAWEKVQSPVLAVHGEFDWIMGRADHERIVETVNRLRPGTARFLSIPRTDHNFWSFESPEKAFRQEGGRYSVEATESIVRFVRQHLFPTAAKKEEVAGLEADGPAADSGINVALFGRLIGDWDVDVTYYTPTGVRRATGTWSFGWVLEGRAIQDVWRVSTSTENPLGYGTTIRFYDPAINAWRVTWHGVLNGLVYRFIARQQGSEIVMEGQEPGDLSRWIFSEIEADSFKWRAVTSADGGQSWTTQQQMVVRRRPGRS